MIKIAFLAVVLFSFAGDKLLVNGGFSNHDHAGHFEDLDFLPLVAIVSTYGAPEEHKTINEYLQKLHGASPEIFDYWVRLQKKYDEFLNKWKVKDYVVTKFVPRLIARFGPKSALEILLKTASHPVGYIADGAQILLEVCGYEMAGKIVGAGGNVLGGVLAGFAAGGPPGAFLGGVMGLGIWATGEFVHYEHIEQLESFVKKF